jgi:hypothetical protein
VTLRVDKYELLGDWWNITNSGAWISDAAVEGTAKEMREIARAIRTRDSYFGTRCAVVWEQTGFEFHSPRNSSGDSNTRFSCEEALALAWQIERDV